MEALLDAVPTVLVQGVGFGHIKGRIFDVAAGDCWVLAGLGFGMGYLIGKGVLDIFALIRYF